MADHYTRLLERAVLDGQATLAQYFHPDQPVSEQEALRELVCIFEKLELVRAMKEHGVRQEASVAGTEPVKSYSLM